MEIRFRINEELGARFFEELKRNGLKPAQFLIPTIAKYVGKVKPTKEGVSKKRVGRPRLTAIEKQYGELLAHMGDGYKMQAEMAERACPGVGNLVMGIWCPLEAEWAAKPANFENLTALQLIRDGRPWEKFHVPNSLPPEYRKVYDELHIKKSEGL